MDIMYQWQIDLIAALQTAGVLELPMKAFTFLGSEEFFLLLLAVSQSCDLQSCNQRSCNLA